MKKIQQTVTLISMTIAFGASQHSMALDSDHYVGDAYVVDSTGKVVRNAYGECWRTAEWTPEKIIWGCGGPEPVTAALPAPPPPPAQMPSGPAQPLFEKITMKAETLFDFDKTTIRPAARAELDDVVNKLQNAPDAEIIEVTGHTDRIGSAAYNHKLSERRAHSVKTYLMSKGVPSSRVHTIGKGKSEPVTRPEDCKRKHGNALIRCYQPDRRVIVDIAVQRQIDPADPASSTQQAPMEDQAAGDRKDSN